MHCASQGKLDEALASYDRALSVRPDYAEALNNRGNHFAGAEAVSTRRWRATTARSPCGRTMPRRSTIAAYSAGAEAVDEALASYDRALALRPDYAEALNNRGNALQELKRYDEALASYDRALTLRPDYAEALNNRGNALQELKRYRRGAGELRPRALAAAGLCRGAQQSRRHFAGAEAVLDEALASYDRAAGRKGGSRTCVQRSRGLCDEALRLGQADTVRRGCKCACLRQEVDCFSLRVARLQR